MPTTNKTMKIPEAHLPRMKRIAEMIAHHNEVLNGLSLLSQQLMDNVIKELNLINHDESVSRSVAFSVDKGEIEIIDEPKILTPKNGIIDPKKGLN